jgi:intein-encoded DNA endonuclease-like protein
MSKVIIEFDSFEDKDELETCINAQKYKSVLYEIMEMYLRQKLKHGVDNEGKELTTEQYKVYEEMQEFILEELHNHDLTLNSLY